MGGSDVSQTPLQYCVTSSAVRPPSSVLAVRALQSTPAVCTLERTTPTEPAGTRVIDVSSGVSSFDQAAQIVDIVAIGDDVLAVLDIADLDLKKREIQRIDAGFQDAELQALLAAMGHEIFGVEKFLKIGVRPGVGHDLAGVERLAVVGDDAAIKAVRDEDHGQQIDPIEDVEENRDAERSRRNDLGLIAGLAARGDDMARRDIGEAVDFAHDPDLVGGNRNDAGLQNLIERDKPENEPQRRRSPPPGASPPRRPESPEAQRSRRESPRRRSEFPIMDRILSSGGLTCRAPRQSRYGLCQRSNGLIARTISAIAIRPRLCIAAKTTADCAGRVYGMK